MTGEASRPTTDAENGMSWITCSPFSVDETLNVLGNERRRYVIRCFEQHGNVISLPDLADEVAVREFDARIKEIPADEVKRIYVSLYHSHIPKLADVGLVTYCQEQDLVNVTGDIESLLDCMDQIPVREETS